MTQQRIAILGTVGIPGNYGGFETLAQNLADYNCRLSPPRLLTVYCSAKAYKDRPEYYGNVRLRYVGLNANGMQSVLYDIFSLIDAVWSGTDRILLLGVSGALFLPLTRMISGARIVTNIDGIEWKRKKWSGFARAFLRASEWAAVRFSHQVIADNQAIANYVSKVYGVPCEVIAYGGDHAVKEPPNNDAIVNLPSEYALSVCRIEPENSVDIILEAFSRLNVPLVFGNWEASEYGRKLKARYIGHPAIITHDSVYESSALRAIRDKALFYVHGHSAGGTNPSLVEMMHFGVPILAHGCIFNRCSTEGKARYFTSIEQLVESIQDLSTVGDRNMGSDMLDIAQRRYNWEQIGASYFELLERA